MSSNSESETVTRAVIIEDYFELESALEELVSAKNYSETLNDSFDGKGGVKSLRRKIAASTVSRSQSLPFLAAVRLDMSHRNPIGLKTLFVTWLEQGNRRWLNPFDRQHGMGKLEEILFKYQGDETILCPFVSLLRCLAEKGISPSSFAAYVILPRMKEDYNWRKWEENHLKALWIIAGVLIAAKGQPPFNQENIGSAYSRLSRDIVLSKYVGKTLAQYQLYQLCYTDALNAYRQAWQKISLNNFLSIYFIRLNILHFVYAMSGKIDMAQLIAIIEQLPDIEQSFASAFPQNITFDQFKKIQNINLFNHDIDTELQARRRRGYHRLDFALEIKAYLEITKVLLEKNTGVYLCAYYTRILKRFKDPAAANVIVRLVRVIDDRDGMHIYKWHTKKLLQKSKEDMPPYVDFIEEHGGCDPEYPQIHLIFRDEEAAHEES